MKLSYSQNDERRTHVETARTRSPDSHVPKWMSQQVVIPRNYPEDLHEWERIANTSLAVLLEMYHISSTGLSCDSRRQSVHYAGDRADSDNEYTLLFFISLPNDLWT